MVLFLGASLCHMLKRQAFVLRLLPVSQKLSPGWCKLPWLNCSYFFAFPDQLVCIVYFMPMNVIFLCKACIIFSSLFSHKNRLILVQFWFCRCLERAIIAGLSRVSYDNKFCKCHSFGHCYNSEPHWHHLTAILEFVRILVSNCFYVIKGDPSV